MKYLSIIAQTIICVLILSSCGYEQPWFNPIRVENELEYGEPEIEEEINEYYPDLDLSEWELYWAEEFEGPDSDLDDSNKWWVQNSDVNTVIDCGRWRENCEISNGTLKLMNRGPKEGYPSNYTSGNVKTVQNFLYGYLECRYKYAAAHATNNSFWIMGGSNPYYEIDINEGHYPNEIATNIINHSVSPTTKDPKEHYMGVKNAYSFKMKSPVITNKIRFSSVNRGKKFHIPEFRIYNVNSSGYPNPESSTADSDISGLVNYASSATITSSGSYTGYSHNSLANGNINVHWVTQDEGEKWVEFEWSTYKKIGCIQFLNGWISSGDWVDLLPDYKIEYFFNGEWKILKSFDAINDFNLATNFNIYGLEWNEKELIYYFNYKEVRRIPNNFAHTPAPIWLSEAILPWKNPVPEEIIGTQMEVDYVRVYKKK